MCALPSPCLQLPVGTAWCWEVLLCPGVGASRACASRRDCAEQRPCCWMGWGADTSCLAEGAGLGLESWGQPHAGGPEGVPRCAWHQGLFGAEQ